MHPSPRLIVRVQLAVLGLGAAAGLLASFLILMFAFRAGPTGTPPAEPPIAVRLASGTHELVAIHPPVVEVVAPGGPAIRLRTPASLVLRPGGWTAREPDGRSRVVAPADAPLELGTPDAETIVLQTGVRLLAGTRLRPRSDLGADRFDAIAEVPLERYVAGVVSAETLAGWGDEMLKAQAVAARSYAIDERLRARAARRSHDIDAGQRAQAFEADPRPDAARAAEATRGVVLTSAGRVLRAYYSSTCGGRPASAIDNWQGPGNDAAPLQAASRDAYCQHAPLYRWTVRRPLESLSRRLAAWGADRRHRIANLGVIRHVEVIEINDAGRPTRYEVRDVSGAAYRIAAESLRLACNHALDNARPERPAYSNDLELRVEGLEVVIDGRGYGHGVGLCQYGAAELASRGQLWPAILSIYYPGAALERAYE